MWARVRNGYPPSAWQGDTPPNGLKMAVALAGNLMAIQEVFKRTADVVHVLVMSPVAFWVAPAAACGCCCVGVSHGCSMYSWCSC